MRYAVAALASLVLTGTGSAAVLGQTVLRVPVRPSDVRTYGTCLSQPSSQLAGTRIQCFGGAGSHAVLVKRINTATYGILPSKVGVPKVYGRGLYESATGTLKGRVITIRVTLARRDALDVSEVGIAVVYTRE